MYLIAGFVTALLFVAANAGSVTDANMFIDTVLYDRLRNQPSLDPIFLETIKFKVKKTGITNRDVKAEFNIGNVTGLSRGVFRVGDCSAPGIRNGNVTVGCNIQLRDVIIRMEGNEHGDEISGTNKHITAYSRFIKGYLLVEATGYRSNYPGVLANLGINANDLQLQTNFSSNLNLNSKRMAAFRQEYEAQISRQIYAILQGRFRAALDSAIKTVNLPPA